jgi:hypothetical protein
MNPNRKITKTYKFKKIIDVNSVAKTTIDATNLTFIINLNKTKASDYLDFMEACKKLNKEDEFKIISSKKYKNNYLTIQILNNNKQHYFADKLCNILIETNIDFIAIDELFPKENKYILKRQDCLNTKDWVIAKIFTPATSQVIVL